MRALFVLLALLPGLAFAQGFSGGGCNSTNATCKGSSLTLNTGALTSSVANGASAIGFLFNTSATYSTSGAKLASFKNNGTEKAYVTYDGYVYTGNGYRFMPAAWLQIDPDGGSTGLVVRTATAGQILFESGQSGADFAIINSTGAQSNGYGPIATPGTTQGMSFSGTSSILRGGVVYIQGQSGSGGTAVAIQPGTLATCVAGLEGALQTVARSGATRTKLCMCSTADGSTYAWQNMATAALGDTTTCG